MIMLIDYPKKIAVIRVNNAEGGGSKRERLGFVVKTAMEIPPELESVLKPGEKSEVNAYLDAIKAGQQMRRRAAALALPETLRECLEYLSTDATEIEHNLIAGAIVESNRALRSLLKSKNEAESAAA